GRPRGNVRLWLALRCTPRFLVGARESGDDAHDVFLAHDEVLGAFDLHSAPRVLSEQDAVADFDVERLALPVLVPLARADADHLAGVRPLGGFAGDDDPAGALAFLFEALDDDAIMQRTDFHEVFPPIKLVSQRPLTA